MDKNDLILEEVRYIRKKVDDVSDRVSSNHTRLDDHLTTHKCGPDKLVAGAAIVSVIISILVLVGGWLAYAANVVKPS